MPAQVLVAGAVVRGKTQKVLNKRGIVESVNGNQFIVRWAGETHAQSCTKHAIQLWIDFNLFTIRTCRAVVNVSALVTMTTSLVCKASAKCAL